MLYRRTHRSGLSLIELLVVVTLLGVFATAALMRFGRDTFGDTGARSEARLLSLAMLHARMGGFIRQLGLHISSLFLGVIVTFSWWGVNNLGVGLHSYGFTEGVWRNLFAFWAIEAVFILIAMIANRRPLIDLGKANTTLKEEGAAGAA